MNYNYYDLGNLSGGATVRVDIEGDAPNVRLMDSSNYRSFQRGEQYRVYGGQPRTSPVLLHVPHSGHWFVVLDYGGHQGRGRASVQVLSNA
ncbi:DUF1883 domain-containing protein [Mycobacterium sp. Dal123C01]|uniref:DUF1883 domain-containing protein n=1 Tax=Mycobacterium sp. Dal123C01 TaxID=3457577 RepID=UPI00403E801F